MPRKKMASSSWPMRYSASAIAVFALQLGSDLTGFCMKRSNAATRSGTSAPISDPPAICAAFAATCELLPASAVRSCVRGASEVGSSRRRLRAARASSIWRDLGIRSARESAFKEVALTGLAGALELCGFVVCEMPRRQNSTEQGRDVDAEAVEHRRT